MSEEHSRRPNTGRLRGDGSETKARVMDVGEAMLAEEGYRGVSLEEIARRVGVSKPALYYHFPEGKEQLFVEIAHRALRQHREGLEREMASAEDGAGRLRAAARWLMGQNEVGNPTNELRDVARFVHERHRASLAEGFYGALYGPIRRAIAAAIDSGEFRRNDPDFLTWAFLGLASSMLDVARTPAESPVPRPSLSSSEMADQMVKLFVEGVAA
ncbi:MAG TPA: TetR/AcrR family transcriptional regulator [Rubrobacter sp.]|nr:TetR/AcrR family transcriptional regulator [Rubrobacter sp.]